MTRAVRAALVGGPMYDPLYDAVPEFEASTGIPVDIVAKLPHPELNAYVRRAFESGTPGIDLLSTHTKYAPSQVQWLSYSSQSTTAQRWMGPGFVRDVHPEARMIATEQASARGLMERAS